MIATKRLLAVDEFRALASGEFGAVRHGRPEQHIGLDWLPDAIRLVSANMLLMLATGWYFHAVRQELYKSRPVASWLPKELDWQDEVTDDEVADLIRAVPIHYAWTERYCLDGGAGAHDGTSEANAWSLAEAITNVNAGHRVNVKAGTFANTTTSRTFGTGAGAATTTSPKWWRGYKSSIGDMDGHPSSTRTAGTDIPSFTFTSGLPRVSDPHNIFSNIDWQGSAPGTHFFGVTGSKCKFIRCRFDCTEAAATSYTLRASADGLYFCDCWFKGTSSVNTVTIGEERMTFDGCVFRGGGDGIQFDATGSVEMALLNCVFDDNGDDAIQLAGSTGRAVAIDGCTIYSPGGHGINITTAVPVLLLIRNNLFHTITTASKYAVNMPSNTNVPHLASNYYYNVTTLTNNITEDLEFYRFTELSSDPLPNASSHDFTLSATATALGIGLPQLFEGP